jgi:regulator of protease activity HflC (stomatin/prohibitin superfamily)
MKMKTVINEGYRGVLFKDGRFERLLEPGAHRYWGQGRTLEVVAARGTLLSEVREQLRGEALRQRRARMALGFSRDGERVAERDAGSIGNKPSLEFATIAANPELREAVELIDVPDNQLALHYVDARFADVLRPGRYAFWKLSEAHSFTLVGTDEPLADASLPAWLFAAIDESLFTEVRVMAWERARLFYDGRFVRLLDEGTYRFWDNGVRVDVEQVDTRLQQMDIQGQEMLTADKVTLRVNFVIRYRVTDFVQVATKVRDATEQLRVLAQMALREYVGRYRLDTLLENKDQLGDYVLTRLKSREAEYFVEITDASAKDIILPGEIRDIMNTVLVAEKRAQANVITRREEVASTRSLLNTAKLMEENPALMRLKEMEYLERVCENVGTITVNGGSDLLGQLTTLLGKSA